MCSVVTLIMSGLLFLGNNIKLEMAKTTTMKFLTMINNDYASSLKNVWLQHAYN